jgi:hypothetical protein
VPYARITCWEAVYYFNLVPFLRLKPGLGQTDIFLSSSARAVGAAAVLAMPIYSVQEVSGGLLPKHSEELRSTIPCMSVNASGALHSIRISIISMISIDDKIVGIRKPVVLQSPYDFAQQQQDRDTIPHEHTLAAVIMPLAAFNEAPAGHMETEWSSNNHSPSRNDI